MQLATELTISSEEFDVYEIFAPPVTIAFHLREFNVSRRVKKLGVAFNDLLFFLQATIAYAEATGSVLELRFTDPAAPLFIDMEGDESESLFVISTSQIQGMPVTSQHHANPNLIANAVGNPRKRPCPDAPVEPQQGLHSSGPRQPSETPRVKKSTRAVQRTDVTPSVGSRSGTISSESGPSAYNNFNSMSPPSFVPELPQSSQHLREPQPVPGDSRSHEPLFYPSSSLDVPPDLGPSPSRHSQTLQSPLFYPLSQLSQADAQVIRESGLGIEYMDSDGLKAMLEGEGEEVEYKPTQEKGDERQEAGDSLELFEELDPTQQQCVEGRKVMHQNVVLDFMLTLVRLFDHCSKTDSHPKDLLASMLACWTVCRTRYILTLICNSRSSDATPEYEVTTTHLVCMSRLGVHWKLLKAFPCGPRGNPLLSPSCRQLRSLSPDPRQLPIRRSRPKRRFTLIATMLVLSGAGYAAYEQSRPFRHSVLAVMRCSRVAGTVCSCSLQYGIQLF